MDSNSKQATGSTFFGRYLFRQQFQSVWPIGIVALLANLIPASGQGLPETADYFPMRIGNVWVYQGSSAGITADVKVEIDRTSGVEGRIAHGFFKTIVDPDAHDHGQFMKGI